MGRTLKRVPLEFDWPLNETWSGYLNPHWEKRQACPSCDGSGYSPEAKRFHDEWYGKVPFDPVAYGATPLTASHPAIVEFATCQVARTPEYYGRGLDAVARRCIQLFDLFKGQWCHHLIQADVDALVKDERLWDFTREARTDEQREIVRQKIAAGGNSWLPESNGYTPTADEVNAWSIGSMGHDSINAWSCLVARCEREGVDHTCAACDGEGDLWPNPESKAAYESWEKSEPPTGDGFQLWETTSEGSPQSPVFATIEALCEWCALNATTFGSFKASASKWREMLDKNFVCHQEGHMVFL